MKKRDIIYLINADRTIKNNKPLIESFSKLYFPNIDELKPSFEILKKEIEEIKRESEDAKTVMDETMCSHDVRIESSNIGIFNIEKNYCPLCQKSFLKGYSWFDPIDKDSHTAIFKPKYYEDDDWYEELEDGYSSDEVIEYILKIIEPYEAEDEIDLVEEFSKLQLKGTTIDKTRRKKEIYILIIGGTNINYLKDNIYVSSNDCESTLPYTKYFSDLSNAKIFVLDRKENTEEKKYKIYKDNKMIHIENYNSLDTFINILKRIKKIPFKIIIDVANLYEYKIENEIEKQRYNPKLDEIFRNSKIIRIGESIEEKNINFEKPGTNDEREKTCIKIKKLIRK